MSQNRSIDDLRPGLILGFVSCVWALLAYIVPTVGLVLALLALASGIAGCQSAREGRDPAGIILGIFGVAGAGAAILISSFSFLFD